MGLTPAEKQRRYRQKLKQDPVREAEAKRKHLQRYHERKKLVKDMTEREHRAAMRKWRIANKKRRERQKMVRSIVLETPESSPRSIRPTSPRSRGRKQVRRDRSAAYRQNIRLQKELEKLKKKCQKYKKRYQRAKKFETKTDRSESDRYSTSTNAIKEHYAKVKSVKKRRFIREIFKGEKIQNSRMKMSIVRDSLGITQLKEKQTASRIPLLVNKIQDFFCQDDVSRATAGKRETVTYKKNKMQKRFLLDTRKNLFSSFKKENPDLKCSYSYFARHRPFFVKPPSISARETCLCKIHTNVQYMANALHKMKIISDSNMNNIIEKTVCATDRKLCMTSSCESCQTKQIKYNVPNKLATIQWPQWTRKSEIIEKAGRKLKVTKNVKEIIEGSVAEMIQKFVEALKEMKKHVYNIKIQFKSYRAAVDDLKGDETVLHVDFSENYSCKHYEEIQSHHFGGSRKQVTLHTGVLYLKPDGSDKPNVESFCTISGNNSHNPASIWAHLHPVVTNLKRTSPHIKTIHFFSDGPATQYRQKQNFHMICSKTLTDYKYNRVTWNFFEAGHGKGAADGVGGFLKRAADQKVATGTDISDAESFFRNMQNSSKIKLYFVTDDDIKNVELNVPKNIIPLQGTLRVHQVFTDTPGILQYRDLSCFCERGFCSCQSPRTYEPVPKHLVPNDCESDSSINNDEILADISNTANKARKCRYYDLVYSSNSSTDEDEPLANLRPQLENVETPSASNCHEKQMIEKENVHPSRISVGTYLLVKVNSDKNHFYTYLGVAKSEVDDEGDIKIMFFKTIDDSGTKFKAVESDVSFEPYENVMKILPNPKIIFQGKRKFYVFEHPLQVFEK